jgi:hypothetical protein
VLSRILPWPFNQNRARKVYKPFGYTARETKACVKRSILWNITLSSPLKVRRFRGICSLHLQGRRINQAKHQRETRWHAWLILRSWRWARHVPAKRRLTFNGLHNVISRKIELFITTPVKTSNPRKACALKLHDFTDLLTDVKLIRLQWTHLGRSALSMWS